MEKKIYLFLRYLIILSLLFGTLFSVRSRFETVLIIFILIFIWKLLPLNILTYYTPIPNKKARYSLNFTID